MRGLFQFFFEAGKVVLIALLVVVPVRLFVFQPFLVRGESMEPNYHNGDYLIVDQLSYRFGEPERGEVVVLKFPFDQKQRFIKRIVGLPGESVEVKDGKVVLYKADGSEAVVLNESSYLPKGSETPGALRIDLKEGEYFVLGDNRPSSSDSRKWGVLSENLIVGRVFLNVFSLQGFAKELNQQETY